MAVQFQMSITLFEMPFSSEQLTTYKELSSLANELHDPDLLYKFMQLAKHNAAWNAKKVRS